MSSPSVISSPMILGTCPRSRRSCSGTSAWIRCLPAASRAWSMPFSCGRNSVLRQGSSLSTSATLSKRPERMALAALLGRYPSCAAARWTLATVSGRKRSALPLRTAPTVCSDRPQCSAMRLRGTAMGVGCEPAASGPVPQAPTLFRAHLQLLDAHRRRVVPVRHERQEQQLMAIGQLDPQVEGHRRVVPRQVEALHLGGALGVLLEQDEGVAGGTALPRLAAGGAAHAVGSGLRRDEHQGAGALLLAVDSAPHAPYRRLEGAIGDAQRRLAAMAVGGGHPLGARPHQRLVVGGDDGFRR